MHYARFIVSGRVQGVFFRASARDEAKRLGVNGHARNLLDGNVEVCACGSQSALAALERWLHVGPPAARVETVRREHMDSAPLSGFHVL
jgi:acylphosphatase